MYTTIIHPLRKSLNISCNEYCVLDMIYHLSNNFEYGGWCIKSKQAMADELDLSKQTILTIINALVEKGLIIRDENTKHLRIGKTYQEAMQDKSSWIIAKTEGEKMVSGRFTDGKETLPSRSRNFTKSGKETLPNNNIDNNKDNNTIPPEDEFVSYGLAQNQNVCKQKLIAKYRAWVENGWKTGKDKKIKNWKSTLQNTIPYILQDKTFVSSQSIQSQNYNYSIPKNENQW